MDPLELNKDTEQSNDYTASTREELLAALKLLVSQEIEDSKDEIEQIKQIFYRKVKTELEEKKR